MQLAAVAVQLSPATRLATQLCALSQAPPGCLSSMVFNMYQGACLVFLELSADFLFLRLWGRQNMGLWPAVVYPEEGA